MPAELTITWPKKDVADFLATMKRAERDLNKSTFDALTWAGAYLARSLAAATKQSPRLRPVIANPDDRWKTDRRRAPFGVMAPTGRGTARAMAFRPIVRTGEFGKLRFFDKESVSWFQRDAANPKGRWEKIQSGPDVANPEIVAPGIMTDERRVIGRSGLAKQAWQRAAGRMRAGGTISAMDIHAAGQVTVTGKGTPEAVIRIDNNLRYAGAAFKSPDAVQAAMGNAHRKLAHEIYRRLRKRFGMK